MFVEIPKNPHFPNIKFWDSVKIRVGVDTSWRVGKVWSVNENDFLLKI